MNLPNKLTVVRMIMIIPFVVFMLNTGIAGDASKWIAVSIFIVASLTDLLDGKTILLQILENLWILWQTNCLSARQ